MSDKTKNLIESAVQKFNVEVDVDKVMDSINTVQTEKTEGQEKYQAFFQSKLKQFGVTSPNQLDAAKKKEFFAAVKSGWKG